MSDVWFRSRGSPGVWFLGDGSGVDFVLLGGILHSHYRPTSSRMDMRIVALPRTLAACCFFMIVAMFHVLY